MLSSSMLAALWLAASPAAAGDVVTYVVAPVTGETPFFDVTAEFISRGNKLRFSLPSTRPGDVTVHGFASAVSRVKAQDTRGAALTVKRVDPQTWEVQTQARDRVHLSYRAYLSRRDVLRLATSWIDRDAAFIDAASVFVYSPEHLGRPALVHVRAPAGWSVVTPLEWDGGGALRAKNYRQLVDRPIALGATLRVRTLQTPCGAVRLVLDGSLPEHDERGVDEKVTRIVKGARELFLACPFADYTAFLHWRPDLEYGGGLEHGDSVTLNIGAKWLPDLANEMAGTFAHEILHAWNGEAIFPSSLEPWNYRRPNVTPFLWLVEGATSYLADMTLARSGIRSEPEFLETMGRRVTCLENETGRRFVSLEEASIAEWVRPVETVDYYCGGEVVAFLLDLEIRRVSGNRHGFDDVVRALYAEARAPSYRGYDERDLSRVLRWTSGVELGPFLARLVRTGRTPDYDGLLRTAGLELVTTDGDGGKKNFIVRKLPNPAAAQAEVLAAIVGRRSERKSN